MTLTLQQLRSTTPGVEPTALLPGQICFNVADKILYVGNGSSFQTSFDGTQTPGVTGQGWYAMPMDFSNLGDYFVANPELYGDNPTDQQVLTWSSLLGHPIWTNGGGSAGNQVYVVTNNDVAVAPGANTSVKISNAIGVASPDEGDVTIVTGLPDDVYEGLYFFTTTWIKGAAYAYPSASEVIYNNVAHPTLGATVQAAINDLDDGLIATTAIANTANSTANSALSIASAALPKAGGNMTGPISAQNISVQAGYSITFTASGNIVFNNGVSGTLSGISDSATATSSVVAASSTAVKTAYDLANAALARSGGTMTGAITFVAGQVFPVSGIQNATTSQKGVVQIGTNIDVASGTISVKTADTSNLGLVSVGTNIDVAAGAISVKTADASNLGLVQVGTNIDVTSGVISVKTGSASDLGLLQVGTNLDILSGVVSVKSASTTQAGIVQLNNTVASNSTTQALTAAQGLNLQSQINSLTVASNTKLAGSLDCATGFVNSVTTDGIAKGFVVGNVPPSPAPGNANYYLIVTVGSLSYSPPGGGGPYAPDNGDWFLSNGTSWQYLGVGARPSYASTTTAGIVQLADNSSTQAGSNATLAVTPAGLQSKISDSTSTTSSIAIASSTAVKSAYDLANAALPLSGGTMTGTLNTLNVCLGTGNSITFNGGADGSVSAISDSISTSSSTTAASSTAVKSAYDLANSALQRAGGTMTGDITLSGAGVGIVFNDASTVEGISDSTSSTSSIIAASSTAVKSAYDLANSALQRAGGTMTGAITFVAGQTFPISGIQDATTGQKGVVQIGTNIQVSSGTISVNTATTGQLGVVQVGSNIQVASGTISVQSSSTAQTGVVQLNDTVASTSTTQALTANQGYQLQQQINALSTSNNVTFAGTFNAATSLMVTVTNEGSAVGFAVGSGLPVASATVAEYFVIVSTAGTTTPPGGVPTVANVGDWFLASASSWTYIAAGYLPPAASTTTAGIVQLATNAQTQTGTNSTNAVVPAGLQSKMSDSTSLSSSTTIASSTAVKSAYDLANAAVPRSCYTALGALAAGTGISTVGTLAIGTTGQFLAVNTACPSGLQWVTECFVNDATYAAKGDIVAGTGSGTYSALSVGTNGQFLTANSACTTGMQWCTLSLACVPCSAFTAAGQLLAGTGTSTFTALTVGSNNQILVADSACTGGLKWLTSQGAFFCGYTCTATPFNTAIGCGAGVAVTSSTNSTFVGNSAGKSVTSGGSNTSLGTNSACSVSTGARNTGVGHNAIIVIGTGNDNTAVGAFAGQALSTGSSCNTVLGSCALYTNSTGGSNVALGAGASQNGASGSNNVAVGVQSMQTNSSSGSVGVGFQALLNNTSGLNVAVGCTALRSNTTATCNTAVGTNAGFASTGANQTFIGHNAGCAVTTGDSNTLVGSSAGTAITTGTCNVAMGLCALNGAGVINQANNVAIGAFAGAALTLGSNTLVGFCSGATLANTSGNTFMGCGAGRLSTTGQANTAIGCGAMGTGVVTGSNNFAGGILAGDALTSGSTNTFLGYTSGRLVTTGGQNTIVGAYGGTTALANNVVLADGAGTIRFQANSTGAISFDGTNFGTAGQTLQSNGTAAVPTWVTPIWQNLTTLTLTSTTLTTLLSVSAATFRGVVINLSVSDVTGGKFHTDTLQVNHDGTTANVQVIGGAHSGAAPYTASAAITAGNLVVSVTSATTNSTKYVGNYMTFAI